MGADGLTPPPSWRLAAPHDRCAQGFVVSPFSHLPEAVALLIELPANGAGWLVALRSAVPITTAVGRARDAAGRDIPCAALAFTATGLAALGLRPAVLATFAPAFIEGMHDPDRRRRLGDAVEPQPRWGGNTGSEPPTQATVHAALLLYAASQAELDGEEARARAAIGAARVVRRLRLVLKPDPADPAIAREHFGFADGISQPVPYGSAIVTPGGQPYPASPVHGMAAGDVVLGHVDGHGAPSLCPGVAASAASAGLPEAPGAPAGMRNLGLDGSYLVMRELTQDVPAFWASMAQAGQECGQSADWVAERVVGRTRDGVVLAETPPPATADGPGNDFLYFDHDANGLCCPLGSHVRRANPRDGLAPDAGSAATILAAANKHRILRRGRKFIPHEDSGGLPGLLFMCLNTDLERQFEFVQQSWVLNPGFATLFDEVDPLVGAVSRFTIPARPLRYRPQIDIFVKFIGGEYFFLPSLPALDYLGAPG